ncbi:hypothetical protein [Caminibacter sp.]
MRVIDRGEYIEIDVFKSEIKEKDLKNILDLLRVKELVNKSQIDEKALNDFLENVNNSIREKVKEWIK